MPSDTRQTGYFLLYHNVKQDKSSTLSGLASIFRLKIEENCESEETWTILVQGMSGKRANPLGLTEPAAKSLKAQAQIFTKTPLQARDLNQNAKLQPMGPPPARKPLEEQVSV